MKKKILIFLGAFLTVVILGSIILFYIGGRRLSGDAGQDGESNIAAVPDQSTASDLQEENGQGTVSRDIVDISVGGSEQAAGEDVGDTPEEEVLGPDTFRLELSEDNTVTFTFAGDILFDPAYAVFATYRQRGSRIEECISEDLLTEMRAADVMMVNNEFTYTNRGEPTPDKTYTFRAPTDTVSVLFDMGVDIVSIANNHTFDYGEISLLDTLDTLEQAGMPYVGAGRNLEEAIRPIYYLAGDMKIAVISATQIERNDYPDTRGATEDSAGVFRCFQPDLLVETIERAKEECDFVILYIHWGTESTDQLDWSQTYQAPLYVEAGADIIIGDHPHCLQEIGYIDGVPIIYSLGNFWFNSRTLDSCIVKLTLNEEGIESLQFVPCLQSGCSVSLLHGDERARVIAYMQGLSSTAHIDEEGYVTDPAMP